jgi:hypothetical protein
MEELQQTLSEITLDDLEVEINAIITIQSFIRGHLVRKKRLPNFLYTIRKFLIESKINFNNQSLDGRLNSNNDEENIINLLIKEYDDHIVKSKYRMWHDILIYDFKYGWLPVNIKTTNMNSNDNVGNLAICVHSYTDMQLDLDEICDNNKMSKILIDKLKNKKYTYNCKKDYYFLVLNKSNNEDIVINSIKGLSHLTHNLNNLPFQVCWNKNREYNYTNVVNSIKKFTSCFNKNKLCWKEKFLLEIRQLN